jgi:hypothetical protein
MIGNLIRLVPAGYRGALTGYAVLSLVSVILRASSALLLVPLLAALFSSTPADALPWLGALTGATVGGWIVEMIQARIGYRIGSRWRTTLSTGWPTGSPTSRSDGSPPTTPRWRVRPSPPAHRIWCPSSRTC